MTYLKKAIRKAINTTGYDICRAPKKENIRDIDLYYRIWGKEAVESRRFLNIGAGSFRHPAWTNVEHQSEWYKDILGDSVGIDWDLLSLTRIPVDDISVEVIYSSHTIEHITDQAAQNMFDESYRILKRGGFFRVTTPNIDLCFRAYKDNDRDFYYFLDELDNILAGCPACKRLGLDKHVKKKKESIQQVFLWSFASGDFSGERIMSDEEVDRVFREMDYEDALNYCISKCSIDAQKQYPMRHINWWNEAKLLRMLGVAGFDTVYRSAYGHSFCPVLRNTVHFDNTHPKISLYVEAVK